MHSHCTNGSSILPRSTLDLTYFLWYKESIGVCCSFYIRGRRGMEYHRVQVPSPAWSIPNRRLVLRHVLRHVVGEHVGRSRSQRTVHDGKRIHLDSLRVRMPSGCFVWDSRSSRGEIDQGRWNLPQKFPGPFRVFSHQEKIGAMVPFSFWGLHSFQKVVSICQARWR